MVICMTQCLGSAKAGHMSTASALGVHDRALCRHPLLAGNLHDMQHSMTLPPQSYMSYSSEERLCYVMHERASLGWHVHMRIEHRWRN